MAASSKSEGLKSQFRARRYNARVNQPITMPTHKVTISKTDLGIDSDQRIRLISTIAAFCTEKTTKNNKSNSVIVRRIFMLVSSRLDPQKQTGSAQRRSLSASSWHVTAGLSVRIYSGCQSGVALSPVLPVGSTAASVHWRSHHRVSG